MKILQFVFKFYQEICTLGLAVAFNGDQLSFINFLGLLMCFMGIIGHVSFKIMRSTKEMSQPIHNDTGTVQGCNSTSNSNIPGVSSRGSGCESGKPLLNVNSSIEGESDVEIEDSWNR